MDCFRWQRKEVGTAPFPKAKEYHKLKIGAYDQESEVDLYTTDSDSEDYSDSEDSQDESEDEELSEDGAEDQELLEDDSESEQEEENETVEKNWWDSDSE